MTSDIIVAIVGALTTIVVVPLLNNLKEKAKSEQALNTINMQTSLLDQRQRVLKMLEWFLAEHALSIASTEFPRLANEVASGKLREPATIKAELYRWGERLKQEAKEFFSNQNIDLLAVVGEKALDQFIDAAAAKVSPFPGKETAVELLEAKVAPALLNYGCTWLRKYYAGELDQHEVVAAQATGLLPAEGAK